MSKSKGNVILPEEVSKKYGIDSARLFLVSQASPDKDTSWSDRGTEGSYRFIIKLLNFADNFKEQKSSPKLVSKIQKTIRNVTEYIENMKYNLAVIEMRELYSEFERGISKQDFETYIKLLAPFAPHVAEEIWEKLGHDNIIVKEKWPSYREELIDEKSEYLDELIENLKDDIRSVITLTKIEPKKIKVIISDAWKYEFMNLYKKIIKETRDIKEITQKVMQTDLRTKGQEITKLIPLFLKDESKLTKKEITQREEIENIKENIELIKDEFKCEIEVECADNSNEAKAKKAMPGKPAVLVE
jgi:leucyl-tRNA synthetase